MNVTQGMTSGLCVEPSIANRCERTGLDESRPIGNVAPLICARLKASPDLHVRRRLPEGAAVFSETELVDHVHVLVDGWAVKYVTLLDGRGHAVVAAD